MSINQVQNKQGYKQPANVQVSGKCRKRRAGQSDQPSAFAQKLEAKQEPSTSAQGAHTKKTVDHPQSEAPKASIADGPSEKQDVAMPPIKPHTNSRMTSLVTSHESAHHLPQRGDMHVLVPHELTHKQGLGQIIDREQRHEHAHTEHVDRLDASHVEAEQRTTHQHTQRAEQTHTTDRQVLQTLVEQIVKSCHVGQNARKQRVLLMHVEIPGQGKVHIKLEQQRQGTRLRFRVADASLAQKIKSNTPALHENLRARGVDVTRVEVSTRSNVD